MAAVARGTPGAPGGVLVVGVSARAIAESARRAGCDVWALDAFLDLDLERAARIPNVPLSAGATYSPEQVARLAHAVDVAAVAYAGGWENHPGAVRRIARSRELLGNAPNVLARVRNPVLVARALRDAGLPAATVCTSAREARSAGGDWLVKRRSSAGGSGVAAWDGGARVPRGSYLQERIHGASASIVFAADGHDVVPLALTRQLIGEPAFGAGGFRYCGSVLAASQDPQLGERVDRDVAIAVARAITRTFGLRGLNGVDLVLRDGVPIAVEVNPRWTASVELVERATGISMFDLHARACRGALPSQGDGAWEWRGETVGKAVLFARTHIVAGDTRAWLDDDTVRDIPRPGQGIARGRPLCTIFARARTGAACEAALVRVARRVHRAVARAGLVA